MFEECKSLLNKARDWVLDMPDVVWEKLNDEHKRNVIHRVVCDGPHILGGIALRYRFYDFATGEMSYHYVGDGFTPGPGILMRCLEINYPEEYDMLIYEQDVLYVEEDGTEWRASIGSFGDCKGYAYNGVNSCRELLDTDFIQQRINEQGHPMFWFTIADDKIQITKRLGICTDEFEHHQEQWKKKQ